MNTDARIRAALEAFESGDTAYAVRLLEDLERELLSSPDQRRYRCPTCGLVFRWPGELDHHWEFGCGLRTRPAA